MTCTVVAVPTDGRSPPFYCGDTIKYLMQVLDEDNLPFTGTISAARAELRRPSAGTSVPLSPPVIKTISGGTISVLSNAVLEIIFVDTDTKTLVPGLYEFAIKVVSPDFGEATAVRMLSLSAMRIDI